MALNFSYTLTQQEVYDGLRLSGTYKTSGKRALIETIVLVVFCMIFAVSYVLKRDVFSLVMAILTAVFVLALNFVPRMDMRKQAKKGQLDVKVRLYPTKMVVETGDGAQTILLDGSSEIKAVGREHRLLIVRIAGGGLLIIPERSIPKEIRGQALNLLLQYDR